MEHKHFSKEQLTERFELSAGHRNIVFGLIGVGLILILLGIFFSDVPDGGDHGHAAVTEQIATPVADYNDVDPAGGHGDDHGGHHVTIWTRVLSNLLLSGVYFMTIAMGAMFFLTVHKIGNAGWQTAIRRVIEAMTTYTWVGALSLVGVLLLLGNIYEWAILPAGVDELIDTKRSYLNEGFFIARSVLFFGVWILAALYLRRLSLREDIEGGLNSFNRATPVSAIFVIFFAVSYSFFAFDWIMSLEPHWFSTIFGVYVFAGSMQAACVTLYLLVVYLKRQGYMEYVNDAHLHDIGKYTFGFSVFWGYIWVAQYLLIWYSNIPEEGIYYVKRYRVADEAYLGYAGFFYLNVLINFVFPFLALMTRNAKRNPALFLVVGAAILYGHFHDLFLMIMPGAMGQNPGIGLLEIGFFATFAGLFLYVIFQALSKANLVPINHPYLEESLSHSTGAV